MNDLTFGATLLACFAALIGDLVLESASAPRAVAGATLAPAIVASAAPQRLASGRDCLTIAQAPHAAR